MLTTLKIYVSTSKSSFLLIFLVSQNVLGLEQKQAKRYDISSKILTFSTLILQMLRRKPKLGCNYF